MSEIDTQTLTDFLKEDNVMRGLFSTYEINEVCAAIERFYKGEENEVSD